MLEIINDAIRDETVKVLVITGTGRAFCVGANVKSLEFAGGPMTLKDARVDLLPTILL